MSEHELWNELGNLYFLSGSYNQAVHAYNKAIQLESGFGKPFSNLALTFTKQAKYEDAIPLYKKSLDLLTDDAEKAITWNRLGNVYRQLKKYEDAVVAYQCADVLRSNTFEFGEQSNQMLYISSESEFLFYEEFEEQQEHQNRSTDYMIGVEPEFDDTLPEFAPVEAEIPTNEVQYNQNILSNRAMGNIGEPVPTLLEEDVEIPELVIQEDRPSTFLKSVDVEEIPQIEAQMEMVDEPGEQALSEVPLTEVAAQESDSNVLPEAEATLVEEDVEVALNEVPLETTEAGARPEEDALETDSSFSEPVAQAEDNVEALPDNLTSALSKAAVCLDSEAPARDDGPIVPIIPAEEDADVLSDEPGTATETDIHPDKDISGKDDTGITGLIVQTDLADEIVPTDLEASTDPDGLAPETSSEPIVTLAQTENDPNVNEEYIPDPFESAHPIDTVQQTVKEEAQIPEKGIGVEEEKLAKQIEINPRNATTWEALGTLYKTAGRYEEAIQAFEQAVSIAPGAVSHYHNLGLVYSVLGNNEGAFNAFQKVLELDPNHSLTHASLGGYYKKIGLEELAQHHIGKAMKNIYESENEYNRACLEAICGNITQAIKLLRTALEKKQTYVDWVLHDPDLDSLRDYEGFKQLIADYSK